MVHYLVKLNPHDKFFFGTGKEFGVDNQNYFIHSSFFPQQTSLLGMLRYQLLRQADDDIFKNNKIQNGKKASLLIGPSSFVINEDKSFGKIKSLSPVFISKKEEDLYPLNREYQKSENSDTSWDMRQITPDFTLLKDYDPKNGLPQLLVNHNHEIYQYQDIFQSFDQVGIRKNYKGKSKDNAFYLQNFMKFKDKHTSFAFYVDSDIKIENNTMVFLGGERQSFNMKVQKVENPQGELLDYFPLSYQPSSYAHKLVLLSDAYFDKNIESYCDFAITDLVKFRCLQAQTGTEQYYDINKSRRKIDEYRRKNLHKSTEVELYSKGSVFYFKDEIKLQEFSKELKESNFFTIGYNYFKTIRKNNNHDV